jgi:hypothetical protein
MPRAANTSIRLIPDASGFWLEIHAPQRLRYKIQYVAFGTKGHQRRAEIEGETSGASSRRFIDVSFPVIAVGAFAIDLVLPGKRIKSEPFQQIAPTAMPDPTFASIQIAYEQGGRVQAGKRSTTRSRTTLSARRYRDQYGMYGDQYGMYGDRDAASSRDKQSRAAKNMSNKEPGKLRRPSKPIKKTRPSRKRK